MRKQTSIPGTEPERIDEIEEAADAYVDVRDRRMALTKDEVAARAMLLARMQKHNLTNYRITDQDRLVVVQDGEAKVKVRKEKLPRIDIDVDEEQAAE